MISTLFNNVDAMMHSLPPTARLCVWAAVSGICSMLLYRRFSPQSELDGLISRIAENKKKMRDHEGSFDEALALSKESLRLAMKRLTSVALPSLAAGVPVILVMLWMEKAYAQLPAREYFPFGPEWMRGWLTVFMIVVSVAALSVKQALRIK